MVIRKYQESDKKDFDKLASHPLAATAWGDFRAKTGVGVLRLVRESNNKIIEAAQITLHRIPRTPWKIAYWPKCNLVSSEMIEWIKVKLEQQGVVMLKMEPNIRIDKQVEVDAMLTNYRIARGKPLFTKWSFEINLLNSLDELMAGMKQKTRYNTKLAMKKGVEVKIDNTKSSFEEYWKLTEETTKRQGFYAHTKKYHEQMFETLTKSGIANLFVARYQDKVLATWVIFELNGIVYYPYGASTRDDRNVFASNLLMWEVICWAKKRGNTTFDLWGSPGPSPKDTDPWAGFHKFKEGFGATLYETVGTYDLILRPNLYKAYLAIEKLRWMLLKLARRWN